MAADSPAIDVRRAAPEDLDFIMSLEADPSIARFVTAWSRERHLQAIASSDERQFVFTDAGAERRCGFLLFVGLDNPHRSIELRRIVAEPRGRGFGRAALRWSKRWAFDDRCAHRLWLDVKPDNTIGRALYASEGFIEEGTLRECIAGPDGYESAVVMALLEHEHREREKKREKA